MTDVARLGKDLPYGHLNIHDNHIADAAVTSGSSFAGTGITVQYRLPTSASAIITGNIIDNARIGIHANNASEIRIGGYDDFLNPIPNEIHFNVDDASSLTYKHSGIWLQNSHYAIVKENIIDNDNFVASGYQDLLRGIAADNSQDMIICGNTITKAGYAMRFEGSCLTTRLKNNIMWDYFEGVHFENAKFTKQGDVDEPWNNEWNRTDNNFSGFQKVEGNFNPPGKINWYYSGTTPQSNPLKPDPYNSNIITPVQTNSTTIDCETALRSNDDFNRDSVFGPVVGDTAVYDSYEDESRYLARADLFKRLSEDPSLLTTGSDADESFAEFYEDMLGTNVSKFDSVNVALRSSDLAAADEINSRITDDNDIELNIKTINDLVVNKVLVDSILNSTDTTTLEDIFSQHWLVAGNSVYSAASILFKEYYSPSISFRLMEYSPKTSEESENIMMFPNPTKGEIYFSETLSPSHTVKIYDGSGRIVSLTPFSQRLSISNIDDGFYIIKIYNDNKVVFNKTLIKLK